MCNEDWRGVAGMMWVRIAKASDVDGEDVVEATINDRVVAVVHGESGFRVVDGICTHEHAHLADGFVFGDIIECPKHQGRFDIRDGAAKGAPASVPLGTYATRVVDGWVEAEVPSADGA